MARLNAKLCLAAACLLSVCTAGASAAGNDVAQEDLQAQIAKLQEQQQQLLKKELLLKKEVARTARSAVQPSLKTEDGHVYITTGAIVRNVTDLLDSKTAMPLLRDQEAKLAAGLSGLNETLGPRLSNVERRSTKNVADLLDELTTTGKATLEVGKATLEVGKATSAGITALVGQVKRVADAADAEKQSVGGGTATKAAGAAFNPFTASVGALGGDRLRVTFPKGAELIADPSVKMYQCKFTYLKDKKLDPTKSKTSEAVAADTERTFSCVVPAWADKGKMPDEPNFTTNFEVLENNRVMPAPSGGQVIKWTPQSPSFKFKNFPGKLSGGAGTPTKFSVDMSILYDYGEVGYKDVKFTAATDKGWAKIITQMSFSGTDTSAERKMGFTITHPKSGKEEQSYWIDVTITSSKYKLSTKHRLNFDFKAGLEMGLGGEKNVLTPDQMATLYTKLGIRGKDNLKLCYNPKIHGYSSSTMHSKCDNRGRLFLLMRRNKNGRVFGGHVHHSLDSRNNYVRSTSRSGWLWTANPGRSNKIDFLIKKSSPSYQYYFHSGYQLTWGGGHDLYCSSSFTSCYANVGHDYDTNGRGYHTNGANGAKVYLTGDYSWNHRESGTHGMVYEVYTLQ